jgi:hypothetical protein
MKHGNGRLLVEAFGYAPYFKHLDKPEFKDIAYPLHLSAYLLSCIALFRLL